MVEEIETAKQVIIMAGGRVRDSVIYLKEDEEYSQEVNDAVRLLCDEYDFDLTSF